MIGTTGWQWAINSAEWKPNNALQPTANPLRGLPSAELRR